MRSRVAVASDFSRSSFAMRSSFGRSRCAAAASCRTGGAPLFAGGCERRRRRRAALLGRRLLGLVRLPQRPFGDMGPDPTALVAWCRLERSSLSNAQGMAARDYHIRTSAGRDTTGMPPACWAHCAAGGVRGASPWRLEFDRRAAHRRPLKTGPGHRGGQRGAHPPPRKARAWKLLPQLGHISRDCSFQMRIALAVYGFELFRRSAACPARGRPARRADLCWTLGLLLFLAARPAARATCRGI